MDCGRLLACLQNVTQITPISFTNDSLLVSRSMNEPLIDSETYTINKVCFTLALIFSIAHIVLLAYFRRLCRLYGICIILELTCFVLIQLLTLISCSLHRGTLWSLIIGKMADFAIMAAMATNLMAGVHVCRQLWLGATLTPLGSVKTATNDVRFCIGRLQFQWRCRPFYAVLCVLIIVLLPGSVLLAGTRFPKQLILSDDHLEFANISCNMLPDSEHLYLFFPTIATLLTGQFICLAVAIRMRFTERQDGSLIAQLPQINARLWITVKLTVTYCLVWTIAFMAIFHASVALWHVFTLLCSLQSIFVTVNSVFSRPVLDLIHQWQEEKMDELKAEQTFVCRPLKVTSTISRSRHSTSSSSSSNRMQTSGSVGSFARVNNNVHQHPTTPTPVSDV